jgi:hypothetical protein
MSHDQASAQPSAEDHPHRAGHAVLGPGSPVRTALYVVAAYAVLGAVAGVVWEWVWTPPGMVAQQHQLFYDSDHSLRAEFTGTGLYVLVGAVASALLALAICLLTRGRELYVLLLVLGGSAVAAAFMWRVGTLLGPGDPAGVAARATAPVHLHGQLTVSGTSPYLAWPIPSLLVLAIVYFAWPGRLEPQAHPHTHTHRGEHREAGTAEASRG